MTGFPGHPDFQAAYDVLEQLRGALVARLLERPYDADVRAACAGVQMALDALALAGSRLNKEGST